MEIRLKVIHLIVQHLKLQNYKVKTILNAPVVNGYFLMRKRKIASSKHMLLCIRVILFHTLFV